MDRSRSPTHRYPRPSSSRSLGLEWPFNPSTFVVCTTSTKDTGLGVNGPNFHLDFPFISGTPSDTRLNRLTSCPTYPRICLRNPHPSLLLPPYVCISVFVSILTSQSLPPPVLTFRFPPFDEGQGRVWVKIVSYPAGSVSVSPLTGSLLGGSGSLIRQGRWFRRRVEGSSPDVRHSFVFRPGCPDEGGRRRGLGSTKRRKEGSDGGSVLRHGRLFCLGSRSSKPRRG